MLEPIHIENDRLLVHTFRAEDIKKEKVVSRDIYEVLSDEVTTRFVPGKKLSSLKEAQLYFRGNLLSYYAGKNYLHFITDRKTNKIVGLIDVITPEQAKAHYRIHDCPYFIEFYLKSEFQGCGIMGELLPEFISQLQNKKVGVIGAVINHNNISAQKLVIKSGFHYDSEFDFAQDFYTITLN
jgi:RimJ/RimL family protein N-acetyltransferase